MAAEATMDQAKEQAEATAAKAKEGLRSQVDERSTQAGEQLKGQAGDVRSLGEELRKQGKDGPAKLADQAADHAEKVGSWLTESDADRILGDVEDYARRNPWTVAAGGLVLGFAASRFLKASSESRREVSSESHRAPTGNGNGRAQLPQGPQPTAHPAAGTTPGITTPTGPQATPPVPGPSQPPSPGVV